MINRLSVVAALAVLAACSSGASTSGGSTTSAADASSTEAATTTVAAAATTIAPTTLPATTLPATTTTVAPEPLVLREGGLGPFDFGVAAPAVIEAITAQFGAPSRNDLVLYTIALPGGGYEEPGGYSLAHPVGRTVCWAGDFCAELGGPSDAALTFIGWWYTGPPSMLASAPNLTIGARWSDFPSMVVYPTCYRDGGGSHHGILLVLNVAGGWDWLVPDATGTYVPNLPDPAATRVSYMWAGAQPALAGLDC